MDQFLSFQETLHSGKASRSFVTPCSVTLLPVRSSNLKSVTFTRWASPSSVICVSLSDSDIGPANFGKWTRPASVIFVSSNSNDQSDGEGDDANASSPASSKADLDAVKSW